MNRWAAIRYQAQELLGKYDLAQGAKDAAFRTDAGSYARLNEIAAMLGLEVWEDDQMPEGMWGYLNRREASIGYHPDLKSEQRNFVIAHELGHFFLKHPRRQPIVVLENVDWDDRDFDGQGDIDDHPVASALSAKDGMPPRYSERDFIELQANVFAAELLAPHAKVREMTKDIGWEVEEIRKYFGLSHEAMANRIFAARLACPRQEEKPDNKPLPEIDEFQRVAAQTKGSALVIAGPGAGKTRVLIERFTYLVDQCGAETNRILALTYSNKAADEMRRRLCAIPSLQSRELEIHIFTFHSFGQSLILEFSGALKFPQHPTMLSEADCFVLLRDRLHELPIDVFEDIANPTRDLKAWLNAISRAKDELATASQFRRAANELDGKEAERALNVSRVYKAYTDLLGKGKFLDFGDLIRGAVFLLKSEVGDEIRSRFDHILVDEFQDINYACGEMVRLLDKQRNKTWVVADPRQSIYGFRGASRANLENFASDFPGASVISLANNYRSVEGIVRAGDAVDFSFCGQELLQTQNLVATRGASEGPAVTVATAPTLDSEIDGIVTAVKDELAQGSLPKDIAVLCRLKSVARRVSDALEAENIATTWAGFLHEQVAFKDLMAVLLFASGEMSGLLRLARLDSNRLCESDLKKITRAGRGRGNRVLQALYAAHEGKIEGLTNEGAIQAENLRQMALDLGHAPNPFAVLSTYLLRYAPWFWNHIDHDHADSQRYRAAANQMLDLTREFSSKGSLSPTADTSAFIDYVRSSLEIATLNSDDSTEALGPAVTVTTIHKSKGLEWKVVFAPDWTEFERDEQGSSIPLSLIHDKDVRQKEYDRACIAYVALTRARDRLVISQSQEWRRDPNPVFEQVVNTLSQNHHVEKVKWPFVEPLGNGNLPIRIPLAFSKAIRFSLLSQLLHCGQSAKYEHVYALGAESNGYLLAIKSIRSTLRWVNENWAKGQDPTTSEVEQFMEEFWEKQAPGVRQISGFYRPFALERVLSVLERGTNERNVLWHQSHTLTLANGHQVAFHVDEVELLPNQAPIFRLHQWHSHSPTEPQRLLLALYSSLLINGLKPQVFLHNSIEGSDSPVNLSDREIKSRLKSVEKLVETLINGDFQLKKERHCNYCPYVLICPS